MLVVICDALFYCLCTFVDDNMSGGHRNLQLYLLAVVSVAGNQYSTLYHYCNRLGRNTSPAACHTLLILRNCFTRLKLEMKWISQNIAWFQLEITAGSVYQWQSLVSLLLHPVIVLHLCRAHVTCMQLSVRLLYTVPATPVPQASIVTPFLFTQQSQ